jgi:hypothetical protein
VRALAAVALIAYRALNALGGQFDITLPGILDDLWYSAGRLVASVCRSFENRVPIDSSPPLPVSSPLPSPDVQ